MFFSRLELENFRAFEKLELDLGPITIFTGPNNSGKSAILSALLVLAQTAKSADADVPLLLNDDYVELGTYKDVVFNNELDRRISINATFSRRPGVATDDSEEIVEHSPLRFSVTFRYRPRRKQIVVDRSDTFDTFQDAERHLISTRLSRASGAPSVTGILESKESAGMSRIQARAEAVNFLTSLVLSFLRSSRRTLRDYFDCIRYVDNVQRRLFVAFQNMEMVGPFRRPASRTYLFSGERPSAVGARGENAINILVADQLERGKGRIGLMARLSQWIEQADIGKNLTLQAFSPRHYEVKLGHPVTGESENLADVGFGCSQVLPVLVASYLAQQDTTLVLEQPEIHLHPKAQAELGEVVRDLYDRRVQALVETHSEHLILRIQRLVAEGDIAPEDVFIYYVYPDEGAGKRVERMRIGEDGFFANEWPQGFFPERLEEARRIHKGPAIRARRKGSRD